MFQKIRNVHVGDVKKGTLLKGLYLKVSESERYIRFEDGNVFAIAPVRGGSHIVSVDGTNSFFQVDLLSKEISPEVLEEILKV